MNQQPPNDAWGQQPQPPPQQPYPPPQQPYQQGHPQHWQQPSPQKPARASRIGLVAILSGLLIAALAIGGALLLDDRPDPAGSAGSGAVVAAEETTTSAVEPKTVAGAKAAAMQSYEAYAAGDWAAAWDMWTAAAKKTFSRADYERLHTECQTITGLPFTVKSVRVEGDRAIVRAERASFLFTDTLRYEAGAWRYQPTAENMADYRLGVDRLVAKRKKDGGCSG